jgi:hypothetical protein
MVLASLLCKSLQVMKERSVPPPLEGRRDLRFELTPFEHQSEQAQRK